MSEPIPDSDLYRELEIDRAASFETIEAAFRSLAKRNHPDTADDRPAATQRMKRLNEAHYWLSDPERRGRYDRTLATEPLRRSSPATRTAVPQAPGREAGGWFARLAVKRMEALAARAVILRASVLSAGEVQRLVVAREARAEAWDDAFDAVEGWKELFVSQASSARHAERRRVALESLAGQAFRSASRAAKKGRAWALADDAGMAAKEAVEALLARRLLKSSEFNAYFGAWAEVVGDPGPWYFLGTAGARLAATVLLALGTLATAWFARQSPTVRIAVLVIGALLLVRLL